jgi:superoxide dismutase, Fe-Mn family
MTMTRREALTMTAGSAAALVAARGIASADNGKPRGHGSRWPGGRPPAAGMHPVVPLPFDTRRLSGISEHMIVSHHDNNYAGAVKNLNKVELELAKVDKDTPGFLVASLRERELTYTNSMILHEHYFANLGGDGRVAGRIARAIEGAFGSRARWEELFRASALALGGGSGWVILDFNFHTGDLRTYGVGNHTQSVAFGHPLLVLDMYEHAYAIDYGAAHAKYVDAFFANVQWSAVEDRLERAHKAARVLTA